MTGAEARAIAPRVPAAISDQEFALFQKLIRREAGIHLAPVKKALLAGRLSRRLREIGVPSFARYFRVVEADLAERTRMLDCICTNETHFFREPRHFEILGTRLAAEWRAQADAGLRPRQIRIWSTACSTGEEPYSLAMELPLPGARREHGRADPAPGADLPDGLPGRAAPVRKPVFDYKYLRYKPTLFTDNVSLR